MINLTLVEINLSQRDICGGFIMSSWAQNAKKLILWTDGRLRRHAPFTKGTSNWIKLDKALFTIVWQPIQGENDITVGFFAVLPRSYVYNTKTIEREIFPGALFEKNRFFIYKKGGGNTDSCELYWLIFWFHIVILCKTSFHLIGYTIRFYTEIKSSYFEPPLLFCNGDSKNENLNSLQKYRVRPIKRKGILPRLTIKNQKFSQYNSQESVLPPPFL